MSIGPTPSQTIGPFFRFGTDWLGQRPIGSAAVRIDGTVFDGAGDPVPDAMLELWHADEHGQFGEGFGFERCLTDDCGRFSFSTVKPGRVDERQAPHIDVSVFARGLLQRLVTRIYFPDEPTANAADPLLSSIEDAARRATLIAHAQDGGLRFDIHLQGDQETVFLAW